MDSFISQDIKVYRPFKINRRFGGTGYLLLQGRRINEVRNQHETSNNRSSTYCLLHAGVLFGLFFAAEDEGSMLFRNVGGFSADYTSLYSRSQNSSCYFQSGFSSQFLVASDMQLKVVVHSIRRTVPLQDMICANNVRPAPITAAARSQA